MVQTLLILVLAPQLISAVVIQARQSIRCDFSTVANSGDTCSSFAAGWGLNTAAFQSLNPGVLCPNLVGGQSYCVIGTVSTGPASTTSSTSTTAKATTTATTTKATTTAITATTKATTTKATTTAVTTTSGPSPTQAGLAANCNNYHLVVSGDYCTSIEQNYGVSAANFASWNPAIDSTCSNLFLDYYVCVGVRGFTATPTTTKVAPTSTAAPAPSGPSPQMPGIVSNCKTFYQVVSGDGCYAIEQAKGISAANFQVWNPYVDATCSNLWLGYYICVGV